jgi:hypothetical protein
MKPSRIFLSSGFSTQPRFLPRQQVVVHDRSPPPSAGEERNLVWFTIQRI